MKTSIDFWIFLNFFFALFGVTSSQITQCNAEEYMAVVLNLEALRVQFKELKAAFEELKTTDIANLKAKDEELQSKDAAIESIINSLNDTVNYEISALKNQDITIESSMSVLETSINAEIAALKAADTNLQANIDALKNTDVPALQSRDIALEGRIDAADTSINSLQTLTSGHTSSISALTAKDTEIENKVNTNIQDLSALNTASTALSTRVATLEAAKASTVAFYAESSDVNNNYVQTGNGVPLILNKVVHESSSGLYNTGTGKFTTPEIGYYVFTFRVVVTKAESGLVVRVGYSYGRYNVAAETSATVAGGQEAKAVTGTVILLLTKGTEVWLDTHNPGEVRIHQCWFAGWLHQKN